MTKNKINLLLITASVLALAACSPESQSEQSGNGDRSSVADNVTSETRHDDHGEDENHAEAEGHAEDDHGDEGHEDDDGHGH